VGRAAQTGLVLALSGDLGAGKTQLVKAWRAGSAATARVHSPTFTLVNEYEGDVCGSSISTSTGWKRPRRSSPPAWWSFCSRDGVAVIEWAERLPVEFARDPRAAGDACAGDL